MTRADIVTALESTNTSRRTTQAAGVGITRRRSLLRQSGGDTPPAAIPAPPPRQSGGDTPPAAIPAPPAVGGELGAKRLELLRELVPGSKTIAVLFNADFGPSARFRTDVEAAARALGVATPILQASKPGEIETALSLSANFIATVA